MSKFCNNYSQFTQFSHKVGYSNTKQQQAIHSLHACQYQIDVQTAAPATLPMICKNITCNRAEPLRLKKSGTVVHSPDSTPFFCWLAQRPNNSQGHWGQHQVMMLVNVIPMTCMSWESTVHACKSWHQRNICNPRIKSIRYAAQLNTSSMDLAPAVFSR
jgi:hypothetical protein